MKVKLILIFILAFSLPVSVIAETKIGIEIYPEKIAKTEEHNEWIATSIIVDKQLGHLTAGTEIKTWMFGTANGLEWYPSSTRFRSWVEYRWHGLRLKAEHYCRHYFHQFEDKGSSGNKIILEYEF